MPYRDRTGPAGAGPGTGRGLGPCMGRAVPWYGRRGGMGFGGRGFGRMGWGFGAFHSGGTTEKEYLAAEVETLEKNLELLKSRLKELESDTEK